MGRILVIEPNEPIRRLVERTLQLAGHDVLAVEDALSGVVAMEREAFACVVVDSPVAIEARGRRMLLLEYLEAHCPEWRPPLVVMTSWVENTDVLSVAERLGAWAVFAKPFSAAEFLAVVDQCAGGERPAQRWYGIPAAVVDPAGA